MQLSLSAYHLILMQTMASCYVSTLVLKWQYYKRRVIHNELRLVLSPSEQL